MSEWISVDEQMPEEDTPVLTYHGDECDVAWHHNSFWFGTAEMITPTHWQPLPPPPEQEK
jgi:hypothetical protein